LHSAIFKVNWKPALAASTGYYSSRRSNRRLYSSSDQACYLEWQAQLFQKCDVGQNSRYKDGTTKRCALAFLAVPYRALQSDRCLVITTLIQFVCALSRHQATSSRQKRLRLSVGWLLRKAIMLLKKRKIS